MSNYEDPLDELFHTVLAEYPADPLPVGFQRAVLARVAEAEQLDPATEERSSRLSFLEVLSALMVGMCLCAALMVILILAGVGPEAMVLPAFLPQLTLPALTLSWGWGVPVVLLLAVELVLVILAGVQITES